MISVAYPGFLDWRGIREARIFLLATWAPTGEDKGHWPPFKHIKMAVDCSGVARTIEPERHKVPRYFLVEDMGTRGWGKGYLPQPPSGI